MGLVLSLSLFCILAGLIIGGHQSEEVRDVVIILITAGATGSLIIFYLFVIKAP